MADAKQQPADQAETEILATQAVQQFLNACRLTHRDQIADRLMKLCSVAGVVMAQANGAVDASERLHGTADFVLKEMPAAPAKLGALQ